MSFVAGATQGTVRQDEYDRCLPTVTAVTCTRISRASRGVSCAPPLQATRLATPCLGTVPLDPRGYEAFHDATPASVHSPACWAWRGVTSVAPVVEPKSSTEDASSDPSVKRTVLRNPERLPSVGTLPMHPSLAREVFRAHAGRGTRHRPSLEEPRRRVTLMTSPWALPLRRGLWPPLRRVAMSLRWREHQGHPWHPSPPRPPFTLV